MSQSNSVIAPEAAEEIRRLATALRSGETEAKPDLKRLGGESSELAQAVNQLTDAVIAQLQESVRARRALDVATSSVMIADANNVVRYANSSVLDMLRASESELRQDLPDFQVSKIVGSNIDVFHKNPAHQKRMVASMNSTLKTQISVGGKVYGLVATPMFDSQGVRIGTTVEWLDRTTEVRIEKELAAAIEATTHGDFSKQIDMTGAEGVFKLLGGHINSMISNTGDCLNSIGRTLDQLAKGNVSASEKVRSFEGAFGELQGSALRLQETLRRLMSELNHMSSEHDKGDIDVIIDVSKFDNDFAKVASGINAMVNGHISVKKKAMACIAEFGRGNFEAELERFPGKKAFINETVEQVRNNLKLLVEDANMLASSATEGRLQTRADANRHFGDFRRIIQGVNDTLDSVIEPMNNISAAIEALGRNDMGVRLQGDYRGDFLAVKTSFERALDGINRTLFEIVDAVDQVGKSSEQLSGASQSMASNSEEQASAVEEVTSSLTQTNSQVQANTENAKAANQLVIGASQTASEGQTKMEAMTDAMNAIAAASQNIGKIIKVIDEIAFQTNLLALNAAVEAARAGQHGRGFAVVAQEVRNLAGRSAKAARETADMIEDTVKRVNDGVNIAKETREALDMIVTNVVKVKDLVAEIATASTEQSRGVAQINVAMSQVGKAAQDGSKQAEELAAASTELSSLSAQMQESVRRFKLRERKADSSSISLDGLSGLPDELLSQLKALIARQAAQPTPVAVPKPVAAVAAGGGRKPASAIIPLDKDERGFGNF